MKKTWIGCAPTVAVSIFGLSFLLSFPLEGLPSENQIDCDSAYTTFDMNYCAAEELRESEARMEKYLNAALNQVASDSETLEEIYKAQKAWIEYKDLHCGAVFSYWREGTIRGVATISCETRLTNLRTHELWEEFLTHVDNSSLTLSEPDIRHDR